LLKFDSAYKSGTPMLPALASFESLLICITCHVDIEEVMVVCLACLVELFPFIKQTPVMIDHSIQPGTILPLARANSGNTLRVIAALGVADRKIWAEAFLEGAWWLWDAVGEAMEGTTALCHGNIRLVDMSTALLVFLLGCIAVLVHVLTISRTLLVVVDASHEACVSLTVQKLLVRLVLFFESCLDVAHKNFADGIQCSADVLIKFPSRYLNRLISQALNQRLHVGDIAMPHSSKEALCCR